MRNMETFEPTTEQEDVLIYSFILDNKFDILTVPRLYPGKQAGFKWPSNYSDHLSHFLPLVEGEQIVGELNDILQVTAFNLKPPNLLFYISVIFPVILVPFVTHSVRSYMKLRELFGFSILFCLIPVIAFFGFWMYMKVKRKDSLANYLETWNRNHESSGVRLSLGGIVRIYSGRFIGSAEQGGAYKEFSKATGDRHSVEATGHLNVFVNATQRRSWCSQQGIQFVWPLVESQQTNLLPQSVQQMALVPGTVGHLQPPASGPWNTDIFQASGTPGNVQHPHYQPPVLQPGTTWNFQPPQYQPPALEPGTKENLQTPQYQPPALEPESKGNFQTPQYQPPALEPGTKGHFQPSQYQPPALEPGTIGNFQPPQYQPPSLEPGTIGNFQPPINVQPTAQQTVATGSYQPSAGHVLVSQPQVQGQVQSIPAQDLPPPSYEESKYY